MTPAEKNYPTHEHELLAIVRALRKWRTDLLGSHFQVYTDHKTLQNFDTQKDLSKRQARWMEYLSQFDYNVTYIRGEDNCVADALSRMPEHGEENVSDRDEDLSVHLLLTLEREDTTLADIREGYLHDGFTRGILDDIQRGFPAPNVVHKDGLLLMNGRFIVPKYKSLKENLFKVAHDSLGHFGADKSYAALRDSYYWPGMRRDLVRGYIPSCIECQRNKRVWRLYIKGLELQKNDWKFHFLTDNRPPENRYSDSVAASSRRVLPKSTQNQPT